MELRVSEKRWNDLVSVEAVMDEHGEEDTPGVVTGIMVRAIGPDGRWDNYDIMVLEPDSLVEWARSRGEVSEFAMSLILMLLQYELDVTTNVWS